MLSRTRFAVLVAALAAIAAIPATANAGTVPMRGVVSGSPYGAAAGQMAIPVLFSKQTARNTGLKSPVGVIIVKRTQKVKLPDGTTTLPVNLRTGDRFKGSGTVNGLQRRVFYPRVVFTKPVVYFRSKELSLSELSAAVNALKSALANLSNQFISFRNASIAAFQQIFAELAALQKAIAGLKIPTGGVDLSGLQSQIDSLKSQLDALTASLSQYVKLSDLASLISGNSTITTLQSQLTTVCNAVKNATVSIPAPISTVVPVTIDTGGVC